MMATYRTLCRRWERYALIGRAYRRWWRVARAVILRLADHYMNGSGDSITRIANQDCTTTAYRTLCDIVAITSPRVTVKRNLRLAWGEFTGQPRPGDITRSTRAALDHYYAMSEIRGPKTRRMAAVLRGDDNVVVVDTWMARALGVPNWQARNKSTQELTEHTIRSVQNRLRRRWIQDRIAGHIYGGDLGPIWTMAETQAAVWAGMIRTHYDAGKIPLFRVRYALNDPSVPF